MADDPLFDPSRLKWVPSPEDVRDGRSPRGGFTAARLAEWGVPWPPPKGWRQALAKEHRERIRASRYREAS